MKEKFRRLCAWCIAAILIALGFTRRAKKKFTDGTCLLSIYFHAPDKQLFEFCVKWLKKNKFNFLSQYDVEQIAIGKTPLPKSSVIITLDDGWETNEANVVDVAAKYKVPIAIFITTDAIERGNFWWPSMERAKALNLTDYSVEFLKTLPNEERQTIVDRVTKQLELTRTAMTIEQLKRVAKSPYVTIGAHTITHPILPMCNNDEAYYELQKSRDTLEKWIGKSVATFAYPNGSYTAREIKNLQQLGYTLAYNAEPFCLNQEALRNTYELPRYSIMEDISKAEAICRMTGVWQRLFDKKDARVYLHPSSNNLK